MSQCQSTIQHYHSFVAVNCLSDVSQNYQLWCIISRTDQPQWIKWPYGCIQQLLLIISGTVKINRGPARLKYPCGQCNHAIKNSESSITCDSCSN